MWSMGGLTPSPMLEINNTTGLALTGSHKGIGIGLSFYR